MIGCASHKFALSVTEILKDYEKEIEKVNVLMIQLRHLKNRAKLRKYTYYEPVKKNLTRWSSIYNMIGRFFQIKDAIEKIDTVEEFGPNLKEVKRLEKLLSDLDVLHTVTIKLQDNNLDMSDTRALFDAVISQFFSTSKYLSPNANIVDYPGF